MPKSLLKVFLVSLALGSQAYSAEIAQEATTNKAYFGAVVGFGANTPASGALVGGEIGYNFLSPWGVGFYYTALLGGPSALGLDINLNMAGGNRMFVLGLRTGVVGSSFAIGVKAGADLFLGSSGISLGPQVFAQIVTGATTSSFLGAELALKIWM